MILKMIIENFKSYGGVKEIGPFHKSFSSVVGPNGSGKSNVIDAMLFVFGKKASQMRFKKVCELAGDPARFADRCSRFPGLWPRATVLTMDADTHDSLCRFLSSSINRLSTPIWTMRECQCSSRKSSTMAVSDRPL